MQIFTAIQVLRFFTAIFSRHHDRTLLCSVPSLETLEPISSAVLESGITARNPESKTVFGRFPYMGRNDQQIGDGTLSASGTGDCLP